MSSKFSELKGAERLFLIGLIIWTLLQLSRLIAMTLLDVINLGDESEAWRYPAHLDNFAAIFAIPLVIAFILKRGFLTWVSAVMYFTISIVDHVGNFVTTTFVGAPSIAEGMENPYLVPVIMTVFDVLFLILLLTPKFRDMFFKVDRSLG